MWCILLIHLGVISEHPGRPPERKGCLEACLVAAEHEELLEDLFAGSDLLFFALLGFGLEVLAGTGLGDDEVPVALTLEFAVRVFERVTGTDDNSWHAKHPLPIQKFLRLPNQTEERIKGQHYTEKILW